MKSRILAIASAAVLLAGCGVTDKAGAAAIIGETKIPSSQVTTLVNEVRVDIENTSVELLHGSRKYCRRQQSDVSQHEPYPRHL